MTTRPTPAETRRVALVGTGVIGSGWAAAFLARGFEVVATDPKPEAEEFLRRTIEHAWPVLERIGLAADANPARLAFAAELEAAVASAEFVQESAPEDERLKTELLARIDVIASPEVIIASSSSGLLPSRIQSACTHPERIVIGHPFNPVYILPLVEVLGGERTSPEAVDWAIAFYRDIGKRPLRVRTEIPGYISDRLMEAMWREALHMVANGVATTEEIDTAIADGPGLRWAIMGPCLTFHLAGGEKGMAHMLEQFGPALKLPWTKLTAPDLTDELRRRMIEGTATQAGGRSVEQLARERDDCLVAILRAVKDCRDQSPAGRVATPYEGTGHRRWDPEMAIDAPLTLHKTTVQPEWVDYNGHLSESCYLLVFGDASDALFRYFGIDESYRAAGRSIYTVESHINYYREVSEGEPLQFSTQLLDLDEKRLHIFHTMLHGKDGGLLATTEQMLLHVDMTVPGVAPFPPEIFERLHAIRDAHAHLPRPEQVGRVMRIRRKGKRA